MGDQDVNTAVVELEQEIHKLEQQIYCCADAGEKRMLKRRLKQTKYMLLMLLGRLG